MKPVEFTKLMKILTMSYSKDFDEEMIQVWYLQFKDINKETLYNAINEIVRKSKFMPSIAELLEECGKQKQNLKYNILELMNKDGYFKTAEEYEKATMFMDKNIIPSWLKEDIKKYQTIMIENKNLMIGE